MSRRVPVVFFGHGSPTNVLEDNEATRSWQRIAADVGDVRAILCISAHWYTRGTAVTAMATPRTIHDFGRSLPAALFDCQYPAPGSPQLAERLQALLAPVEVAADHQWGLDHGTWSVLSRAWPAADVPVVQLSIDATRPDRWHYELGQSLKPLRDEGVLVCGSGNIVHNLGVMEWNEQAEPYDWATEFNEFIKDCIASGDIDRLLTYPELGRAAQLAIPSPDHFLPLLYVLGARQPSDEVSFAADFVQYKSLSMTSIVLG